MRKHHGVTRQHGLEIQGRVAIDALPVALQVAVAEKTEVAVAYHLAY
jgi:hypothetical protein